MTDPATPVQPDDQPLSEDQLSQIAGGWINYPCDYDNCTAVLPTYDALQAHKAATHK